MIAEILAVGTELLLGNIVNTNAQFLSRELAGLGINVYHQSVVGDNAEKLLATYRYAFEGADIVIATGGLGPTEDDITKETGARFFNKQMILHEESLEMLRNYFAKNNMPQSNIKQAYMPEGAIVLKNDRGTAPGCIIEDNDKILIMLPGPPVEAEPMFLESVVPYLKTKTDSILVSRTLRICGLGESLIEEMLKDIIDRQTNPTIATYAKSAMVDLRITAKAANEAEAVELFKPVVEEVYGRLGDNIFGEDDDTLEGVVVKLLEQKGLKLACAESCTGGMLTARFVDYPGVSNVLLESVVTYSNESKIKRLGVKPETLRHYGAVSKETAAEMAAGIASTAAVCVTNVTGETCGDCSNVAGVSITGVAGPTGSEKKPVGLVYIGLCVNGNVMTKEYNFKGDRQRIRTRTTVAALDFLRRALLDASCEV